MVCLAREGSASEGLETNSYSSEPSIGVKVVEGGPHVAVLNNGAL